MEGPFGVAAAVEHVSGRREGRYRHPGLHSICVHHESAARCMATVVGVFGYESGYASWSAAAHTARCREGFRALLFDDSHVQLRDWKWKRFAEEGLERERRRRDEKEEKALKKMGAEMRRRLRP